MILEESLELNHHGITLVVIINIVLHILGENVTWVDDSRYVLHFHIFGLMASPNHILSEV